MKSVAATFPVVIVEDRYGGMYCNGRFIAIAQGDLDEAGVTRVAFVMTKGPSDVPAEAMAFWDQPPRWIATGDTPDEAMTNLMVKAPAMSRDGKPLTGVCPMGYGGTPPTGG